MYLKDFPLLALLVSFAALWLAAEFGDTLRKRVGPLKEEDRGDFGIVLGATLTLLALLIGFSFSMAVSRYDQRVLFYTTRNQQSLAKIDADTAALQKELWTAVLPGATAQPTPPLALVVSGMNDVLNSQGYTQAAWWNRIPRSAWVLMVAIALGCNVLIGYGARRTDQRIFLIVPIAVSISFFLIADIDSPRRGTIHVAPQNLLSLSQSLSA